MTTASASATRTAIVAERERRADGIVSLRLEPANGTIEPWEPGAHIDVEVADGTFRQYSLCGHPGDLGGYTIAVLREPDGRGGSEYLHTALPVGSTVRMRAPKNHFALETAEHYTFVAGGVGITPILPMIRQVQRQGHPWSLHYFGRSETTMAFRDLLTGYGPRVAFHLASDSPRFDLSNVIGRHPGLVYVCGPERLLQSVVDLAAEVGRSADIRSELFAAPEFDDKAPDDTQTFEVVLSGSGITVQVPPDRSVLDVVLEAGVDVLHDCQDGICGSCETAVLSGEPDHRDHILTERERAQNDCMMICVSRCNRGPLVLDL